MTFAPRTSRVGAVGLPAIAWLLICSAVVAPADAQTLGRLFSTPEQRIELDRIRDEYEYGKSPPASAGDATRSAGEPEAPAIPPVTVNGVVLRSSGHHASWVNGAAVLSGQTTPEGIRVEAGRAAGAGVRLVLPSGSDTTLIRPGQKIDVVNGAVLDTLQLAPRRHGEGGLFPARSAVTVTPSDSPAPADPIVGAPGGQPGKARSGS